MNLKKIITCFLPMLLTAAIAFGRPASSLNVSVTGKGDRAVVLIPGFTCSGEVWDATVKQLGAEYSCHVITFAGFAGKPAQAEPHLKDWVTDIADYITSRKLGKPVVIGHSIGGGMAMMLAATHPDVVSRIVVVDALPCLSAVQNPAFKANPAVDCSPHVNRYTAMSDSMLYATQTRTVPMLCADTAMRARIVDWSMQSDRRTMGRIYCEFLNTDLRESISSIACPALILLEAPFKAYDAAMQQQFAKLLDKRIVYANRGLHFIMYDDKDWYLQQLNAYLR